MTILLTPVLLLPVEMYKILSTFLSTIVRCPAFNFNLLTRVRVAKQMRAATSLQLSFSFNFCSCISKIFLFSFLLHCKREKETLVIHNPNQASQRRWNSETAPFKDLSSRSSSRLRRRKANFYSSPILSSHSHWSFQFRAAGIPSLLHHC